MKPGQLVSRLLTESAIRAVLREEAHVLEVAAGPAAHVGECIPDVARQAVDHLGSPALRVLPRQDFAPDAAVELPQFGVDRQHRALAHVGNLGLQGSEPVGIAHRQCLWQRVLVESFFIAVDSGGTPIPSFVWLDAATAGFSRAVRGGSNGWITSTLARQSPAWPTPPSPSGTSSPH